LAIVTRAPWVVTVNTKGIVLLDNLDPIKVRFAGAIRVIGNNIRTVRASRTPFDIHRLIQVDIHGSAQIAVCNRIIKIQGGRAFRGCAYGLFGAICGQRRQKLDIDRGIRNTQVAKRLQIRPAGRDAAGTVIVCLSLIHIKGKGGVGFNSGKIAVGVPKPLRKNGEKQYVTVIAPRAVQPHGSVPPLDAAPTYCIRAEINHSTSPSNPFA